jgi:spore germination protein YaaH
MYGLSIANEGFLRSAEISRLITDRKPYSAELMKHLGAIERIEARGITYSNEDFDVLSAAYRFALSEPQLREAPQVVDSRGQAVPYVCITPDGVGQYTLHGF